MIKLSIVIVGHPKRAEMIEKIKDKLDDDRVKVSLDTDNLGCWGNTRRAWQMFDVDATHLLLIQDDVMPCDNFIEGAEKALRYNSDKIVSFFNIYSIADKAVERGDSWFTSNKIWGQATCMPISWIKHFLDWEKKHIRAGYQSCDARLSAFAMKNNLKIWNTNPSLVEHLCPKDSIMGNNPPIDRTARNLIQDNLNAVDIDWRIPANPVHRSNNIGQYTTNMIKEEYYEEWCGN